MFLYGTTQFVSGNEKFGSVWGSHYRVLDQSFWFVPFLSGVCCFWWVLGGCGLVVL